MDISPQRTAGQMHSRFQGGVVLICVGLACFAGGFMAKSLARRDVNPDVSASTVIEKLDNLGRSLEGKMDNLSRAVFDLRTVPDTATAATDTLPSPQKPIVQVIPIAQLLQEAERTRTGGNLREAEILLTRAVQTDRDNVSAWRALAAVQREMAATSVNAGSLLTAAQEADRARTSVNGIKVLAVDPGQTIDPKVVTDEDGATAQTVAAVRGAVDAECKKCIEAAWKSKSAGTTPWYWKNNRWWTVDGLKHLRKVIELGAWASEETRMSANEVFSALKGMVKPEEWNDLLARAGFDPGSRETLRKWGLE